jgi:hypothetical protein
MIDASLARIESELPDDALVLDVGGYIKPWARADWVIDIMPFESCGPFGTLGNGTRRFTSETWVQRDICEHTPWPFDDGQFDFATCSHTLEDVRDPIWVCHELNRVAKAGYIEVPSRLEEQSYGFQGPWAGWGHHHWMADVTDGGIEFVFKHHVLHNRRSDHFPLAFYRGLSEEQKVQSLWWEGSFEYGERLILSAEGLDAYLANFVSENSPPPRERLRRARVLSRTGALLRRVGTKLETRAGG